MIFEDGHGAIDECGNCDVTEEDIVRAFDEADASVATSEDLVKGLVQYMPNDGGFTAITETTRSLPTGCYTLSYKRDQVIYKKQLIVVDDLMRLPDSLSDEVIEEIKEFWSLKDQFKKLGFCHKRGFLLHGPPGSGKTSVVNMVMYDMIKMNGVIFIGGRPSLLIDALKNFREVEQDRPLAVILEDIDTIIERYGESEVLSILDGEAQVGNVVFIATTNYPENLDGRVINRPSRFDRVVKIGHPNSQARKIFIETKLGTLKGPNGEDLVKLTKGFSISHIKELIVGVYCQKRPFKEVLDRLKKMGKKQVSSQSDKTVGFVTDEELEELEGKVGFV